MTIEREKYIVSFEVIKDNNNAFNEEEFIEAHTGYFNNFDYVVGDISYGRLRLKGFYDKNNKLAKEHNNIENLNKYITEYCSYMCKYYILKKTNLILKEVKIDDKNKKKYHNKDINLNKTK